MKSGTLNSDQTICLVACTSRKGLYPAPAEFLYRSPLFAGARQYAIQRANAWFVLSAEYGLLAPHKEIAPYDRALNSMSESERRRWAEGVCRSLLNEAPTVRRVIFLAGWPYRRHLEVLLHDKGIATAAPMSSLGIGKQVAWLQQLRRDQARLEHIDRFYGLLARLAFVRPAVPLREQSAAAVHAERGVYFFMETDESRMTSPFMLRVTRIGTHSVSSGSKATLWNRLRTHRGAVDGSGNHRGSIFRLHVGWAIIRRAELQALFPDWGTGQSADSATRANEVEIEQEVSRIISNMSVIWLEVDDDASPDSDRTYIERNLIAMLSGPTGPLDLSSGQWLGNWSDRDAIRSSGLWNINHVREPYDPEVLDVLERYVECAEGGTKAPGQSIARRGWRTATKSDLHQHAGRQLSL